MTLIDLCFCSERDKRMLRNCNGFSILEVIGALSIFLVVTIVMLPIMIKTYEERSILDYKREALVLLHNETQSYLYDIGYEAVTKEIETGRRTYFLTLDGEAALVKLCVHWEVPWNKKGKVCNYAKK